MERKRPRREFCSSEPRPWKKNETRISPVDVFSAIVLNCRNAYFIRVDFPAPGFPLIQSNPRFLCHLWKISWLSSQLQVSLAARPTALLRLSISEKERDFKQAASVS